MLGSFGCKRLELDPAPVMKSCNKQKNVERFCLLWGIYARFVKKMANYSKLILSIILIYSWIGLQYMWCNVKNYRLFETTHGEITYRKRKKLCL